MTKATREAFNEVQKKIDEVCDPSKMGQLDYKELLEELDCEINARLTAVNEELEDDDVS